MKYSTDSFFDTMHDIYCAPPLSQCDSPDSLKAEVNKRRKMLEKSLGIDKIKSFNFEVKIEKGSERRYDLEILPNLNMPMWVLKPEHPNGKTILYLPGHDEMGAKGSFNYYGQNKTFHKWLPLQMQFEGFTVVIPEFIGFGDMLKENYTDGYRGCFANTAVLHMLGMSIAGTRVYQAMCAMKVADEVLNRPVDIVYGISGGSLIAMCLSALNPKFDAVILSNYGATFKSSIMSIQHCIDNYIPNLLNIGECADIIGMTAPSKLFLTNGIEDKIFPIEGVKKTAEELKKIYSLAGDENAFTNHIHHGGHEADSDPVIAYLKQFINFEEE